MSRLLETWCLMEYAEKGSLADALRTGRLKRPCGFPELGVIIACLQDIASGGLAPTSLRPPRSCRHHKLSAGVVLGGLTAMSLRLASNGLLSWSSTGPRPGLERYLQQLAPLRGLCRSLSCIILRPKICR